MTPTTPVAAPTQAPTKRKRPKPMRGEARTAWMFAAPGLLLVLLFVILPFLGAFGLSLTNSRLVTPLPTQFVGVDNYIDVLTDGTFWGALRNNFVFGLVVVPVQTGLALVLAVLVNQRIRGRVVYRTLYFLPQVMVMAAAATVWKLLFSNDGMVNTVMEVFTFGLWNGSNWLQSTSLALPAVIVVSIWQGVGFQMVILLAALQDVPNEHYEAASIDGASTWQQFINVTVPGIRNQLIFVATITMILSFRLYDQVVIMPQPAGGPQDATRTVMLEMVQTGFERQLIGKASAIAVVFFVIVLMITLIQRRLLKEEAR
jgi:multiple sugar transport system permease protein